MAVPQQTRNHTWPPLNGHVYILPTPPASFTLLHLATIGAARIALIHSILFASSPIPDFKPASPP